MLLGACADPAGTQPTVDPTQVVGRFELAAPASALAVAGSGYAAFPHAVRLADGDVLVSWREGPGHMYGPSRILLARYRLEGDSLRQVETSELLDTDEDEREAGLMQTSDGTVLANAFTGTFTSYALDGENWHLVVLRSRDGGRTWRDTVRVSPGNVRTAQGRAFRWLATRGAVVERTGGELLMPVYGLVFGDRRHTTHVLRSTDGGLSWRYGGQIARDRDQSADYNETALLAIGDGLLAVFRSEDGYLRESASSDGGRTWSQPRKPGLWGVPPHLLRLDDGRVLLTRGYRRDRMGVRYALSTDEGRSWQEEVEGVLADDSETEDCGYPSTVQLQDGSLLTVYYVTRRVGGVLSTRIWAVRYRIPPQA
ncbi:MAG TPA: exo-alpha-sialidase [Longimicrobium sp.]